MKIYHTLFPFVNSIHITVFANSNDDTGTPLTCAAENGHEVIVDYLLKSGADVDGKFTEGDNDELVVSS